MEERRSWRGVFASSQRRKEASLVGRWSGGLLPSPLGARDLVVASNSPVSRQAPLGVVLCGHRTQVTHHPQIWWFQR